MKISSESDEECLLQLKRACLRLNHAASLNQEVTTYTKQFTSYLLETVTDNLTCAVAIAKRMRPQVVSTDEPCTQ